MFLTGNFRRYRTLYPVSVLEHTNFSMGAMNVNSGAIGNSRGVPIIYSVATSRTMFRGLRTIVLPNNVPKAIGLRGSGAMRDVVSCTGDGNVLVNTVYTTPSVLNRGNVLGNGGTAYFSNFRGSLCNTRIRGTRIIASNGVVATGNTNITFRFNFGLLRCLGNARTTRGLGATVGFV